MSLVVGYRFCYVYEIVYFNYCVYVCTSRKKKWLMMLYIIKIIDTEESKCVVYLFKKREN